MQVKNSYKPLFTIAAVWNWSTALLFVSLSFFSHRLLSLFLNIIPQSFIWFNLFFSLVVVFGLGYYWAGQDVLTNRNIIKMGILGKLLVFVLVTYAWLTGVLTTVAAGAGAVDLVFAILFMRVLFAHSV